jgi:hypothetical protein
MRATEISAPPHVHVVQRVPLPSRCGRARARGDEYVLQDGLVLLHADPKCRRWMRTSPVLRSPERKAMGTVLFLLHREQAHDGLHDGALLNDVGSTLPPPQHLCTFLAMSPWTKKHINQQNIRNTHPQKTNDKGNQQTHRNHGEKSEKENRLPAYFLFHVDSAMQRWIWTLKSVSDANSILDSLTVDNLMYERLLPGVFDLPRVAGASYLYKHSNLAYTI